MLGSPFPANSSRRESRRGECSEKGGRSSRHGWQNADSSLFCWEPHSRRWVIGSCLLRLVLIDCRWSQTSRLNAGQTLVCGGRSRRLLWHRWRALRLHRCPEGFARRGRLAQAAARCRHGLNLNRINAEPCSGPWGPWQPSCRTKWCAGRTHRLRCAISEDCGQPDRSPDR